MNGASPLPRTVWIALVALTLLAYVFQLEGLAVAPRFVGTAVLITAFVKVRLIGLHYMELKRTVLPLRLAFEAWVVMLGGALITLFALV
ncbi:MAG: hypothetical protein RIS94_3410 [Pseudomonadota bacterium]|jgi:hypothetical protein